LDYVAEKIGLPRDNVETKLSEMILNNTMDGVIDQHIPGNALILFTKKSDDKTAKDVIETIKVMNSVVNARAYNKLFGYDTVPLFM